MSIDRPSHSRRRLRPSRRVCSVEACEPRTLLADFVVTTAADAGPGSLRQAILDANAAEGADRIYFRLPGAGVRTIAPKSPLPAAYVPVTIDATTQRGYVGSPLVEIDGAAAGASADGLVLSYQPVPAGAEPPRGPGAVRGFGVNRFGGNGIGVFADDVTVQACRVGVSAAGDVADPNGAAGVLVRAVNTLIGGPSPFDANVLSGNAGPGLHLDQVGPPDHANLLVQGNFIGTNRSGNAAIGNGAEGVLIEGQSPIGYNEFTLGGATPGQGNVISGNAASGVRVVGGNGHIVANHIGTDLSGARALPNGASAGATHRDGITAESSNLTIGGFDPAEGNVISSNAGSGVSVSGGGGAWIYSNLVGTDVTGEIDLGNGGDGVRVTGGVASLYNNIVSGNAGDGVHLEQGGTLAGNKIGTNAAGSKALGNGGDGLDMFGPNGWADVISNVISANGGHGLRFGGGHTLFGLMMRNNRVGTDVSGTRPLGNAGSGVYLTSRSFYVGGEGANSGNVISANGGDGITVVGTAGQPDSFKAAIQSNRIGTNAAGDVAGSTAALGNRGNGIALIDAGLTLVGDEARGGPRFANYSNTIAHNVGRGIIVTGNSRQVLISPNRILDNGGMGIDLGGDGVTPNDPLDADSGPNDLQNSPVILSAATTPSPIEPLTIRGSTEVRFTLSAKPSTTYGVDFYSMPSADPSGHGGSDRHVGFVQVTTDAAGNYAGTVVVDPVLAGESITATATDPQVNTSEFAANVAATVPDVTGRFVFYNASRYDGSDPAANAKDDDAIATDKQALLPGRTATFANVTSYSRGINGIILDLGRVSAGAMLSADDFEFRTGDGGDPSGWAAAQAPSSVTVRRRAGLVGTDRVTLVWPESGPGAAVSDAWLRVTVKATADTGLSSPDVFYFGNLAGETGNAGPVWRVDDADFNAVRSHLGGNSVARWPNYDFNQDGVINVRDLAVARANAGRTLEGLAAPAGASVWSGVFAGASRATRRRAYDL
jgi:hypothetical protein